MGGSGDIASFEFPVFRSSPEVFRRDLPGRFALQPTAPLRGGSRVAQHCGSQVRRCGCPLRSPVSSIRVPRGSSHPRGAGSQHGLRSGAFQRRSKPHFCGPVLILYAYPGPGLRLAEPAAFHSSTGCRPGWLAFWRPAAVLRTGSQVAGGQVRHGVSDGSATPAERSSCVPRGDLAKDRPAALSPETVAALRKSRASGSPPLIPKHGPALLWRLTASLGP